jgi:hypothetical protein
MSDISTFVVHRDDFASNPLMFQHHTVPLWAGSEQEQQENFYTVGTSSIGWDTVLQARGWQVLFPMASF